MALSEAEKDWLGRRAANEMAFDAFFCPHCEQFNVERDPYLGHCDDDTHCPLANQDFQDAAEFEARVAVKLATVICAGCEDFNKKNICPLAIYQATGLYECRMMHARLAAEDEMEIEK